MKRKKTIRTICLAIIAAMVLTVSVPAVSFADSSAAVIKVTDEAGLAAAVASAGSGAVIEVQNNIILSTSLEIPTGADLTLKGKTGKEVVTIALSSYQSAQKSDDMAIISVNGDVDIENLTFDGQGNLRVMYIGAGGTVNLNDGAVITGGTLGKESINWGAGVRLQGSRSKKATLIINDGAQIKDSTAYGDACITGIGVCIYKYGDVVMNGGSITNSQDKTQGSARFFSYGGGLALIGADSTFTMNGGEISSCYAKAAGAGVYVNSGTESFVMNGGYIRNNKTVAAGGGLYLSGASAVMNGGSIENNIAESDTNHGHYATGGGVYIAGGSENDGSTAGSLGTFYMNGGSIKNNTAKTTAKTNTYDAQFGQGGGVMAAGDFVMTGGTVTGNIADSTYDLTGSAGCGGGVSIKGGAYAGTFSMTGGTVSGNKARNKGGAVFFNDKDLEENLLNTSLGSMVPTPGIGTFAVSGDINVKGNTKTDGSPDNIFLQEEAYITVVDELSDEAELYVATESVQEGAVVAKAGNEYSVSSVDAAKFRSNDGLKVYGISGSKIIYKGKVTETYQNISDAAVSGIDETYSYTGSQIKPEPVVELNGVKLEKGKDYTVSYKSSGYDNVNRSSGSTKGIVKIIGAGEYEGTIVKTFTITARDISETSIENITERIYMENVVIEPDIKAILNGVLLVEGVDYTLSYSDNNKIGTGKVTVTGKGNYTGTAVKEFEIISNEGMALINSESELVDAINKSAGTAAEPAKLYIMSDISAADTVVIPENKYIHIIGNGNDINITAASSMTNLLNVKGFLKTESITLDANKKGRVVLTDKNGEMFISSDTVITGGLFGYGASNIESSGGAVYNNGKLTLASGEITGNQAKNGGAVFNAGTMTSANVIISDNTALMGGGAIYNQGTATLENGTVIQANTADTTVAYTVGNGGAGGGIFNSGKLICNEGCLIEDNDADYRGGGIYTESDLQVNGAVIMENTTSGKVQERTSNCGGGVYVAAGSFTMNSGSIIGNLAKSSYVAKVPDASLGNGGGVFVANDKDGTVFTLNGGEIRNNQASSMISSLYSGCGGGVFVMGGKYNEDPDNAVTPGSMIMNGGAITENSASSFGDGVFISNREYYLSNKTYMDFAGAATLTMSGDVVVADNGAEDLYLRENAVVELTNTVKGGNVGITAEAGGTTVIAKGTGYTPVAEDAAVFKGKSGMRTVQLDSKNRVVLQAVDIAGAANVQMEQTSFVYTGSEIKPDVKVVDVSGTVLIKDKDYTVSYEGSGTAGKKLINTGTKKAVIYGEGEYTGSITAEYEIVACDINEADAVIDTVTYTGSAQKPVLTSITYNGVTLLRGTDYESVINYSNNINAGKAKAIITGKGNFTGAKEITFTISPVKMSKMTVKAIANKAYTGKSIKPTPVVKYGTKKLVLNKDYKLTYKNNLNTGKATVTITGKGNYTGTKVVNFKIVPKKAVIRTVKSLKKSRLTVNCKKDIKASGYQIMIAQNKAFTKGKKMATLNKNTKLSKTFTGLKSKKIYYVKVRSYKTINGVKCYGAYSAVKKIKVK